MNIIKRMWNVEKFKSTYTSQIEYNYIRILFFYFINSISKVHLKLDGDLLINLDKIYCFSLIINIF